MSTPLDALDTISKISNVYNQSVTVLSISPELFKNTPGVDKSYNIDSVDMSYFKEHYEMIEGLFPSNGLKKLLIITPHLSTGGAPQVTVNKVELLKNEFNIKVIEYEFMAWNYVVQRNRIIDLVGNQHFISLGKDKAKELKEIIDVLNPDVISMEEFPEMFMSPEAANVIYNPDRKYTILETTHDSSFNPHTKTLFPDKFIFVSPYSAFKYAHLDIPTEVIEYPIDEKFRDKHAMQSKIGLDSSYKHVTIVGLFTPRKNQAYAFDLARKLKGHKIKFNFLGNYADNFKSYWEPLMKDKPDNCILWGERDDVPDFLQASDMFLFCSKGDRSNKELNPIAIKEAMEYSDVVKLMYDLDVYCGKYREFDNVHHLTGDIDTDALKIVNVLKPNRDVFENEAIVITTYPNTSKRKQLTKDCIKSFKSLGRKIILVSHYPVDEETQKLVDDYIYDSNNLMIHHSYYNRFYRNTPSYNVQININNNKHSNQSLAAMINLFNGIKLCKSLGISKVMTVVYDVVLNEKDVPVIEDYFRKLDEGWNTCLSYLDTDLGKGVETTSMLFRTDYFLEVFKDIRDGAEFTALCEQLGCHNFLEHYFMCLLKDGAGHWIVENEHNTILPNSGLGVSSNSEYSALLPAEDNNWMFYFYTYNPDERRINVLVKEENVSIFEDIITVSDSREYYKPIVYNNKPMEINVVFYDEENAYKTETYILDESTISKHINNGKFEWL
jgi:hypothetical protein